MTRNGFLVFLVTVAMLFSLIDMCLKWERKVFIRYPSPRVTFKSAWITSLEEIKREMEKSILINEVLKGVESVFYFPESSTFLFVDEESFKKAQEVVRKEIGNEPKPVERDNERVFQTNGITFVLKVRK